MPPEASSRSRRSFCGNRRSLRALSIRSRDAPPCGSRGGARRGHRPIAGLAASAFAPYSTRPTPVAYCGPATSWVMPFTPIGDAEAHGHAEDLLGELGHAFHEHGAAREHDARGELLEQAGVLDALAEHGEDLLDARLDDVREDAARGRAGAWPPTPGTSISSSSLTMRPSAQPKLRLRRSASAIGVRRPGRDVCRDVVAANGDHAGVGDAAVDVEEQSVVPPPMSMTATPISFSSSERTASALARGSRTTSATVRPQRSAQRTTFCTQLVAAVIRFTLVPRRTPLMPTGSRMPSWLSTTNSRGRTWRIWRSASTGIARALLEDAVDVGALHLAARDGGDAVGRHAADVAAGDARVDGADLDAGHRLRRLDGLRDGAHRPVDVGDDALAQAAAGDVAHAEDGDPVGVDLAHHGENLGGADVQADDDLGLVRAALHAFLGRHLGRRKAPR
jgi:hypothetical protein